MFVCVDVQIVSLQRPVQERGFEELDISNGNGIVIMYISLNFVHSKVTFELKNGSMDKLLVPISMRNSFDSRKQCRIQEDMATHI